jgi:hypothetical protein
VEWSSTDVAALGLEGANVPAAPRGTQAPIPGDDADSEDDWDDAWEGGDSGDLLQPVDRGGRAPRWQIALVAILLVAVIIALVVALTKKDDPTEPSPSPAGGTTTGRTSTTSAVPSGRLVGELRLPGGTVRIVHG